MKIYFSFTFFAFAELSPMWFGDMKNISLQSMIAFGTWLYIY